MRILVLNHNLRERGTYFRAREVALGFHRLGHDVTFVGTGHGYYRARTVERRRRWHHWESANWSLLREGGEGFSPLGMLQRLGGLRRRRWDLVYTFSHTPIDQGTARLLRRPGTFWMTDWCDLWNSRAGGMHDTRHWQKPLPDFVQGARGAIMQLSYRFEDLLESGAARDADAVSIIVSPMRVYTRKLGIPDERVLELVSGADLGHITPLDRRECRAALGLPEDRLIVGYVANATPDNRQLEEAMRRAWTAFPNLLLLSVGPRWYPPDGFLAKAVQEGRMVDYDRRPFAEIPRYLGASDFLVMPLRDLPFNRCRWPNKFGDYMASGRATATCDVGDMGEVIRRHGVGVAGQPDEGAGLGEAIVALARDAELRRTCGENARKAAESELSWEGQMGKLCAFLKGRGVSGIVG